MDIIIHGGKIATITDGTIENGSVLIKDGKIAAVGHDVETPAGAKIIQAKGKYILPGFIDIHSHIGLVEDGTGPTGSDGNELTSPVTAEVRAIDGINPEDVAFQDAIEGGITGALVTPGSGNVVGGQSAFIRTHGKTIEDMVLLQPAGIKAAFGENPKRVWGGRDKEPSTRMGTASVLRKALTDAQNYLAKIERAGDDPSKMPDKDLRLEALAMLIKREIPLRCHSHRHDDIRTAIRIADEFNIRITIEHATESHKVAEELAKRNIPAVVGPTMTARSKVELNDKTLQTPSLLHEMGVKIALTMDHPVIPIQYLRLTAALAVREGLPEVEAIRAITINAAEIAGVGDQVGSISKGKLADLVIWDGNPLDIMARVNTALVGGKIVYRRED